MTNYSDMSKGELISLLKKRNAPAVQGELVGWQFYQHGEWWNGDDTIKGHRKNTKEAGFRVRDVYAAPAVQSTFTVGTDLSDGKLSVVVMRHENGITWVIHSEVIQLAEQQQPDVAGLVDALEQGFPLLSDEGLDEVEHHCEWVIQRERKRVHSILAAHHKGAEK